MKMTRMAVIAGLLLAIAACDDADPAGPGQNPTPVASVVLEPDTATLTVGQSKSLTARTYASDGTVLQGRGAAWSSSDTTVLRVDSAGVVTARAAGLATVTARVEARTGRATIRVQAPVVPVASVVVGPQAEITLAAGASTQLTAGTFAADGSPLTGRTVTWASNREDVASVDADGLVSAIASGIATITATSEGKSAHARVTVEAPAQGPRVATITVRPSLVVTYAGVAAPLTATLKAEDGSVVTGRTITWSSSDERIATVDADGVVRGHQGGEAVITASVDGKTATVAATFNTTSSYHLAYDRERPAFYWMDMRTGVADKALEHGAGIRSRDPSPSPTRSGFAYVHDIGPGTEPQIAIQSWSGTTYQFLTGGDQPAWSPDGAHIAFRSTRAGRADIWVIRADGSGAAVNLTADLPAGVQSERPAWSPVGDRIIFSGSNTRNGADLWVMKADGSEKHRLTNGVGAVDTEPTWYGDRIVFTRRTSLGTSELYWMYVNGALVQRLTVNGGAQMAAWAPDGRWIAFVVRDGQTGLGDIHAVRPDGSDMRPLSLRTDPDGGGLNPAWTLHW